MFCKAFGSSVCCCCPAPSTLETREGYASDDPIGLYPTQVVEEGLSVELTREIDLAALEDWSAWCATQGLNYDRVHDQAEAAIKARGAWMLFLPQYSPDLNPIEIAFSKLKAHLRKASARTFDTLIDAIGDICCLFDPHECWNFFKVANYAP